jgi:hypothetical protein
MDVMGFLCVSLGSSTVQLYDGLQTEEHIFWDCKRYEEQRATMKDILSENSKKDYPKPVTELLTLQEKKKNSARRLLLHKLHSYIYLKIDTYEKKTKRNIQNTNTIRSDLN